MVEEADKCPGCGTQSYEADKYQVAEVTCRTCAALELRQSDVYETKPPKKPGKKFMLKRRGDGFE